MVRIGGGTLDKTCTLRKGWGVFLKVTEGEGLWAKIRNHVGVTVKHPISPVTREIRSRLSDEGVKKSVSVCPYCAVGCSTLVYHRDGRIIDIEGNPDSPIRSEERRVGKECRSRWSPYH